jgi:hypothetical protein
MSVKRLSAVEALERRRLLSAATDFAASMGGPLFDSTNAVATDSSGDVYTAGITFVPNPADQPFNRNDPPAFSYQGLYPFVAKYTPGADPVLVFKKTFYDNVPTNVAEGQYSFNELGGMAVDSAHGAIYLVGNEGDGLNFDPGNASGTVTQPGMFVVKMGLDGTFDWAESFGTSDTHGRGVAVDSSGDVYVTSYQANSASAIGYQIQVMKLNSAGGTIWTQTVTGGSGEVIAGEFNSSGQYLTGPATDVAVDNAGHVLLTASYSGDASIGDTALPNLGGDGLDLFVAQLSRSIRRSSVP